MHFRLHRWPCDGSFMNERELSAVKRFPIRRGTEKKCPQSILQRFISSKTSGGGGGCEVSTCGGFTAWILS